MFKLEKCHLSLRDWRVEAFAFIPSTSTQQSNTMAIFTHGYTAHKGTLLNWGVQLAQHGIPSLIFDLPGHYLGSFNEVDNFKEFDAYVHHYFTVAYQQLQNIIGHQPTNIILGGHSLGALLSLRAAPLDTFHNMSKLLIPVGFGVAEEGHFHPLQSAFFQPFLTIRRELVSAALAPEIVLPWIETTKRTITCTQEEILLITGQDDVIVPPAAVDRIVQHLQQYNSVTREQPVHLPHHQPELAIKFILRHLRNLQLI